VSSPSGALPAGPVKSSLKTVDQPGGGAGTALGETVRRAALAAVARQCVVCRGCGDQDERLSWLWQPRQTPIADRPRQETLAGVYDWVEKQAAAE